MNAADRAFLEDLMDCLNRMTGLDPSNPADLKAKLIFHRQLVEASRHLYLAISCHGFGDIEDRDDRMRMAREGLGITGETES